MPYLHVFIFFVVNLLSSCSILDVLDLADKKTEVTDYRGTDDIVVGKYGRLGLRDFRSMLGRASYHPSSYKLLPRSSRLSAFSATVQVGVYKRANSRCTSLTSVASSARACQERIAKGRFGKAITEDQAMECRHAKQVNAYFIEMFPDLKFSDNLKADFSPAVRHKIATVLIDKFWGMTAFAPPDREQSIAAVAAFISTAIDSALEYFKAYSDKVRAEKIARAYTEEEIAEKLQNKLAEERDGIITKACTAVLASAPMIFY